MTRRLIAAALFIAALSACGPSNTEAIRHVVLAEIIQRQKVPGSHIDIASINFHGESEATVEVRILPERSQGVERTRLECKVVRRAGRWRVESVQPPARH
jgi:ribosomal protein L36